MRDLEKIDNNMRKSIEADEKAGYYRDRLAAATRTAEGKKYTNPGYLINRIKECEAEIRSFQRTLEGKMYVHSEPKPISDQLRKRMNYRIAQVQDKLDYMKYCLAAVHTSRTVWDKETLKGKTEALVGGRWRKIVRCNPSTISVANASFSDEAMQVKYPLKYNYGHVQDAR